MHHPLLLAVPSWLTQGWPAFAAANLPVAFAGILAYVGEVPWGAVAAVFGGVCTLGVAWVQYRIAEIQTRFHRAEDQREIARLREELGAARLDLTKEIAARSGTNLRPVDPPVQPRPE